MNEIAEHIFLFELTPFEAFVNLFFALLCGVIVATIYRFSYRGVNFSSNNVIAIIMLALITTLVIMVIGSNLARAFGLVGAMSIIRFRTAVKDTQDIMFIFFALAVGLACGASMYFIALLGTVFIGAAAWIAVELLEENPRKREYLLQVYSQKSEQDGGQVQQVIDDFVKSKKLINIKSIGDSEKDLVELSYYIKFKRKIEPTTLLSNLRQIPFVQKVNLFFDED